MTKPIKKGKHGGARPGAGRKPVDPALIAARNPRVGRKLMREKSAYPSVDMDAILMARLLDATLPPEATDYEWHWYHSVSKNCLAEGWQEHGPSILARWMAQRPGTRPSCWWDFDAPRQAIGTWPGCHWDAKLPEPRQRVGGRGTPVFEVLAYSPEYELGVPKQWVSDWELAYYTGHMRDVNGNPIGENFVGSAFKAQRFDRADPPLFESQAAYLQRHGLLTPAEAKRLAADAFQPEPLPEWYWPDQEDV